MTGQEWVEAVKRDFPWTRDQTELLEEAATVIDEMHRAHEHHRTFDIESDVDGWCRSAEAHDKLTRRFIRISNKLGVTPIDKREKRLQRWRADHPGEA